MVSSESFGIMNKAYQVPKNILLEWLNDLLGVSALVLICGSCVCRRLKSAPRQLFTVG